MLRRTSTLIKMTRELAFAASLDAGDRAMSAAGRRRWSKFDQNAASKEFNRLWPLCPHKIDPEDWCRHCGVVAERPEQPTA